MSKRRVAVTVLVVLAVFLLGIVAIALAQPQQEQGGAAQAQPGFQGGGRRAAGQMGMRMMQMMLPPAIAVAGNAVYVVRGNMLYKFDAETLELIAQAELPVQAPPAPAAAGGLLAACHDSDRAGQRDGCPARGSARSLSPLALRCPPIPTSARSSATRRSAGSARRAGGLRTRSGSGRYPPAPSARSSSHRMSGNSGLAAIAVPQCVSALGQCVGHTPCSCSPRAVEVRLGCEAKPLAATSGLQRESCRRGFHPPPLLARRESRALQEQPLRPQPERCNVKAQRR